MFNELGKLPAREVKHPTPMDDNTEMLAKAFWPLEDALSLLASFQINVTGKDYDSKKFDTVWSKCYRLIDNFADASGSGAMGIFYELTRERYASGLPTETVTDKSSVRPLQFLKWAESMSLNVPPEVMKKVKKAEAGRAPYLPRENPALTAAERRELGRLRREKHNFDLAIKATVKAMEFCINAKRRVIREELFDLLTNGKGAITSETFDRVIPLIPQKYRAKSGEKPHRAKKNE